MNLQRPNGIRVPTKDFKTDTHPGWLLAAFGICIYHEVLQVRYDHFLLPMKWLLYEKQSRLVGSVMVFLRSCSKYLPADSFILWRINQLGIQKKCWRRCRLTSSSGWIMLFQTPITEWYDDVIRKVIPGIRSLHPYTQRSQWRCRMQQKA